jgi:cytoskeletal protein CcmA (bactofilin family)
MAGKNEGNDLNLVGAGTVFEGKIRTPGSLRIDGKVIGDVTVSQNIHVGNTGETEGTIAGKNVTIGGKVTGIITAQEKLVLESKAVIKGDIRATKLVIDEGATFDGKCVMSEAKPMASVMELKPDMRRAD